MIPSHEPSCVTPAISKDMRITSKYMIDIKVEMKVFWSENQEFLANKIFSKLN
jgi:hypothetical protein